MININKLPKDILNIIVCCKQEHLAHFVAKSVSKIWYNLVRKWYCNMSCSIINLNPNVAFRLATTYSYTNIMLWLKDEKDIDDYLISEVILNKKFECLKCLKELGACWSIKIYCDAAIAGDFEIFKWLALNNTAKFKNLTSVYWEAFKHNRHQIINWMGENEQYFKLV